jgi:hypothetical protein
MHAFYRSTTAVAAATLLVAGGLAEASTAQARVAPRHVVTGGLVSPLTAGIRSNGTAFISENFAGALVRKSPGGKTKVVYQAGKGTEVGGVTADPGSVTFTLTLGGLGERAHKRSLVMHLTHGKATRFANTGAFERNQNPDQNVVYGFRHLNKRCLSKVPGQIPARYSGIVDTHPYSTATTGMTTYVGDAAGNDILHVDRNGHISLVTVMPAVPLKVTAKRAKANKLPACTIGHRYFFEPVPTDVEVAPDGQLVVTELVGATEGPGFGGQSRVYVVDPSDGSMRLVAKRLAGAVGVAIAGDGNYLVSQLFANEVSRVDASSGAVSHYRGVQQPAAVERVGGKVYVTSRVLAKKPVGRLLRFPR